MEALGLVSVTWNLWCLLKITELLFHLSCAKIYALPRFSEIFISLHSWSILEGIDFFESTTACKYVATYLFPKRITPHWTKIDKVDDFSWTAHKNIQFNRRNIVLNLVLKCCNQTASKYESSGRDGKNTWEFLNETREGDWTTRTQTYISCKLFSTRTLHCSNFFCAASKHTACFCGNH